MTVELGIILTLISCLVGVVSFFIGQKKTSKDEGLNLGKFMGEIRAELAYIKEKISELKSDHKEVDGKIKEAIAAHIEAYHHK